jgi:hypothetical protein
MAVSPLAGYSEHIITLNGDDVENWFLVVELVWYSGLDRQIPASLKDNIVLN